MAYSTYTADAVVCGFVFVGDQQVRFWYEAGTFTPTSDAEADLFTALADRGLVSVTA